MNSVYIDDIHADLKGLSLRFESIVGDCYLCPENQKGTPIQAKLLTEQQEATEKIETLCASIEHKIELLNYKLQIIQTFNWGNYYNFQGVSEETGDSRVLQKLQDGKIIISFSHQEAMGSYILTEISAFFSILSSVIDNIAEIMDAAFKLNVRGIITIKKVAPLVTVETLKTILVGNFCEDNHSFYGMREIRKVFEHKDHRHVIIVEPMGAMSLVGQPPKETFSCRVDVEKLDQSFTAKMDDHIQDRQLVPYCNFLYSKIKDALKQMVASLS